MKKLHLGNGSVYLEGYTNIDMFGPLATDRPDLAEHNKTDVEHYFKFPIGENKNNLVTDMIADVVLLPIEDGSVDEILCVDLLDHIKREEIDIALVDWMRVLKPGGILIIDVDDRTEQARRLVNASDARSFKDFERAMKLIYCEPVDGMTHWWGFTSWYLKQRLVGLGLNILWEKTDYIIHKDPHFQICVQK